MEEKRTNRAQKRQIVPPVWHAKATVFHSKKRLSDSDERANRLLATDDDRATS
ncbi:MAG: hypothetical protein PHX49_08500 [Bacteroidales bacterium]|nr:hypothetical protein [Bacteroidales bacterium]